MTKGLDGCLAIYTRGEWDKISVQVSELPISRGAARSFQRHLFAGAMEVEMDGQGRVVLPVGLRSHAHLEGTAVLAGVQDRIEIWDPELWKRYTAEKDKEISDQLDELGI